MSRRPGRWRAGLCVAVLAGLQAAFGASIPRGQARVVSPGEPPSAAAARLATLGEAIGTGYGLALYTQAFDAQAGASLRIADLDGDAIGRWLDRAIDLDPHAGYPLLLAARVYGEVLPRPQAARMIDLIHRRFLEDPQARWRWLAHAVYIARHVLEDRPLALALARSLRVHATGPGIPGWVRQAEPLLLADMGRVESARVLLGAMVTSGTITDPAELSFLTGRLRELEHQPAVADTMAQEPRESRRR
ncbi:MAG: hypothetical protein AB7P21_24920 [Lautropia sp.]